MDAFLQRVWYEGRSQWFSLLLLPLSWLFGAVAGVRRVAYRRGWSQSIRVARPVIVVGNITVGGTGKTPMTIWLAERLQARGVRVGIVLRGYGGTSTQWPRDVTSQTDAAEVGDEAVLLARRTGALVVAGPDRVAAANRAIERGAQVIVCDDGLQHYRLVRNLEIAVVDERRGLGNGRLLPAGPLREPPSRLDSVGLRVLTRRAPPTSVRAIPNAIVTMPVLGDAVSLGTGEKRSLQSFVGSPVHAIAGIGNPQAFFDALSAAGLSVDAHALPDHVRLTEEHISFPDGAPVLMTEKDAVKCPPGVAAARLANCWAVRLDVAIGEADAQAIDRLLDRLLPSH
jgi:tetraacyldisaccharide 4'-kinase